MLVFRYASALKTHLEYLRNSGLSIGFVPTMGALHRGHLSLLEKAKTLNDIAVVSIYVNPTQFNDSKDFEKYPRVLEQDLALLEANGCAVVWLPSDAQMYPDGKQVEKVDYGPLTGTIEGDFRPGHFDGMVDIVRKLLNTVNPDKACFGQKDFQQLAIIRHVVSSEGLNVDVIGCPIMREDSGLAMSSRNDRLSETDRKEAAFIKKTLDEASHFKESKSPMEVERWAEEHFKRNEHFTLEYFYIVYADTFERATKWSHDKSYRMLVAAYIGGVRLIDNMAI